MDKFKEQEVKTLPLQDGESIESYKRKYAKWLIWFNKREVEEATNVINPEAQLLNNKIAIIIMKALNENEILIQDLVFDTNYGYDEVRFKYLRQDKLKRTFKREIKK